MARWFKKLFSSYIEESFMLLKRNSFHHSVIRLNCEDHSPKNVFFCSDVKLAHRADSRLIIGLPMALSKAI